MDILSAPRCRRLRETLRWSQSDMARRLGVSQSTLSRLELGQEETGPQRILLDHIERDLAEGRIAPRPEPGAREGRRGDVLEQHDGGVRAGG
ncbi:transcriptional regulator [Microcystis phage vB_MweS-yong2]|nr:transcriptional regulator [Microcystis phage vB_MweS-yong2]